MLGFAAIVPFKIHGAEILGDSLAKIYYKIFLFIWVACLAGLALPNAVEKFKEVKKNSSKESVEDLIGLEGMTKTCLKPTGKVGISDKEITCSSDFGFIDVGERVKVIGKHGNYYKVQKV
jgi:membrane-bound ClpP family serine protease